MAPSRAPSCVTSSLISLWKPRPAPRNYIAPGLRRARADGAANNSFAGLPIYAPLSRRFHSSPSSLSPNTPPEPPDYLNESELAIFNKLKAELQPVKLEVQDISGGCGSMYALDIESPKFGGLTVIKQHKLVNQILAEDIKKWHGLQLKTKAA